MVVWGGLSNSWEKKRSKRQRAKGKIYPFECRVPRIAKRDKKAFFSEQCKEIGKTREWERLETSSQKLEILMEKAMAPHSSTLAWKIPWMEEPGGPQSKGLQRVGHDWVTSLHFTWNVPLVSLIFLKRSLVFSILLFSSISLHWSLRKAFWSLVSILWNSAFKWVYLSFYPLPFASLLFSAIYKASSDNHFGSLHRQKLVEVMEFQLSYFKS